MEDISPLSSSYNIGHLKKFEVFFFQCSESEESIVYFEKLPLCLHLYKFVKKQANMILFSEPRTLRREAENLCSTVLYIQVLYK